jgi:nucleoside-diphosphate-sugar epimerase
MSGTFLVTGATGSIGRTLVPALIDAGFNVRGQFARRPGGDDRVEWVRTDFRDHSDFDSLIAGCDAIIHLAAELADPTLMERVNIGATSALIASAQRHRIRYFGLASSMVVYGSPRRRAITEQTPIIDPDRPLQAQFLEPFATREYGRTKVLAERAVQTASSSMAVDIYRIAKSADAQRMLEAIGWSTADKLMRTYGFTHYIDPADCAAAIVHLAQLGLSRERGTEIYNIADGESGTYAELLRDVDRLLGKGKASPSVHVPLLLEMLKNTLKYRVLSPRLPASAARMCDNKLRATGFVPRIGYRRALENAVSGLRLRAG